MRMVKINELFINTDYIAVLDIVDSEERFSIEIRIANLSPEGACSVFLHYDDIDKRDDFIADLAINITDGPDGIEEFLNEEGNAQCKKKQKKTFLKNKLQKREKEEN